MRVTKSRVLLVEDDLEFTVSLVRSLREEFSLVTTPTVLGGERSIAETRYPFGVVVLDRILPDGDGLDLIPYCQRFSPATQICVLSSIDTNAERARGLSRGADLYLAKPFSADVLKHQIRALLRRNRVVANRGLLWHHFVLVPEEAVVENTWTGYCTHCTPNETACLELMWKHPSGFVSLADVNQYFLSRDVENVLASVQVTMQRLRRKLKNIGLTVQARRGTGYCLVLIRE